MELTKGCNMAKRKKKKKSTQGFVPGKRLKNREVIQRADMVKRCVDFVVHFMNSQLYAVDKPVIESVMIQLGQGNDEALKTDAIARAAGAIMTLTLNHSSYVKFMRSREYESICEAIAAKVDLVSSLIEYYMNGGQIEVPYSQEEIEAFTDEYVKPYSRGGSHLATLDSLLFNMMLGIDAFEVQLMSVWMDLFGEASSHVQVIVEVKKFLAIQNVSWDPMGVRRAVAARHFMTNGVLSRVKTTTIDRLLQNVSMMSRLGTELGDQYQVDLAEFARSSIAAEKFKRSQHQVFEVRSTQLKAIAEIDRSRIPLDEIKAPFESYMIHVTRDEGDLFILISRTGFIQSTDTKGLWKTNKLYSVQCANSKTNKISVHCFGMCGLAIWEPEDDFESDLALVEEGDSFELDFQSGTKIAIEGDYYDLEDVILNFQIALSEGALTTEATRTSTSIDGRTYQEGSKGFSGTRSYVRHSITSDSQIVSGDGTIRRLHWVRGHWRKINKGKSNEYRTWVKHHLRGNADYGQPSTQTRVV